MKKLLCVLLLCLLPGCETTKPQSPAQAVYAATSSYEIALSVAVSYKKLPACAAGGPLLCSKPEIVAQLQKADAAAFAALSSAQNIVRSPAFGQDAAQSAVVAAQEAVKALTTITTTLKVAQ